MKHEKLRMGMVGGGPGAFIGNVHRMAAALDGQIELVCGAFSSDPDKSKQAGDMLYLPENRVYPDFETMLRTEAQLPLEERMQFVSIVTPNHVHFAPAKLAMELGFDVVCDKPLSFSLDEARILVDVVEKTGRIFCLTHNYTGYPMVRQARAMVRQGKLGTLRKVVVEYPQGWLSSFLEGSGQKQADWRTDPSRSGKAGCMGDIGTHAENLAEFITGLEIESLAADLSTLVPGRKLDDDGSVLLRFKGGAKGLLFASQIAVGEENNLRIRVYGEKAGLEWFQAEPNTLLVKHPDKPIEIYRAGGNHAYLTPDAQSATRLPGGHPEGYLEAFANLYKEFALVCRQRNDGKAWSASFPGVKEGLRGMQFIEAVVTSSENNAAWITL
jgi:predicted dehydrogenase